MIDYYLDYLLLDEKISGWAKFFGNIYIINPIVFLSEIAVLLSRAEVDNIKIMENVQLYCGHSCVTAMNGSVTLLSIVDINYLEDILCARSIVQKITGNDAPWGLGACARRLWNWSGINSINGTNELCRFVGNSNEYWHCHKIIPTIDEKGEYYMHDLTAAYLNIMLRLPSYHLGTLSDGTLYFKSMPEVTYSKIRKVCESMMKCKFFRNTAIGALTASVGYSIKNGKIQSHKIKHSPIINAAALTVRLCFEATYLANREDSIYKNTDCKIGKNKMAPKEWIDLGLASTIKNKYSIGLDTVSIGTYKVGDYETKDYEIEKNIKLSNRIMKDSKSEIKYISVLENN